MISPLSVIQIIADRDAQIAQLVEQRTENPRVTGSIPVLGIFYLNFKKVSALYGAGTFFGG